MRIKLITIKWVVLIVTMVILSFYLYINYYSPIDLTGETKSQTSQNIIIPSATFKSQSNNIRLARLVTAKLSKRLKIPKVGIDAVIEPVGTMNDGAMVVPQDLSNVGWFKNGPSPGEVGSAVLDGHFGVWKDGTEGVFNNLNQLVKGDKIYVEDKQGVTTVFMVNKLKNYGQNDSAIDIFNSSDGLAHLNLITCEGTWDASTQSYSQRLVVFADTEN